MQVKCSPELLNVLLTCARKPPPASPSYKAFPSERTKEAAEGWRPEPFCSGSRGHCRPGAAAREGVLSSLCFGR